MTTLANVYDFMRRHYKHERFEGRGLDYAQAAAASSLETLEQTGICFISRHEAATGICQIFDARLIAFPADGCSYDAVARKFLVPA